LPLNLAFHVQHLVFEAQLQFLQPHFFQFFVVGEVRFWVRDSSRWEYCECS